MLLEQIKDAGIVGAGGAGFPTHVKLNTKAEYMLMNAAECEPLLRVDQQIMVHHSDDIIRGFAAAGRLVEADKAIIGIKKKHAEAIRHLEARIQALGESHYVTVHAMQDVYPAGDEQVLVYELTGRVVPESGIPIEVGCVVINSETALNIAHAMNNEGVTHSFITLAGDIPNRTTFAAPVGTPIMDILKLSGIDDFTDYAVIDGGPMMGPVMSNLNGYLTKKQKGFIILPKDHPLIRKKTVAINQARRINRAACEQCRMCTDLCPRYLIGHDMQPHKMMTATTYQLDDSANQIALLCCQCGLCDLFACPAGLFPKEANLIMRQQLAEQNVRYARRNEALIPHSQRAYRLVPSKRLVARLQLGAYDHAAPYEACSLHPECVTISTRQHIGAPAVPEVRPGERVQCGQRIGNIPEGALGATIHASIAGTVEDVTADYIKIRRDAHV